MTKTENERYRGILAFTKAGRHNVYTLISDIDIQSRLGVAPDSESSVIIADDLRKEAENFLSSIVLNVPEKGIGVAPQDWFDLDELDRDLTPLIEQQAAETEASLKMALRARKSSVDLDKSSGHGCNLQQIPSWRWKRLKRAWFPLYGLFHPRS